MLDTLIAFFVPAELELWSALLLVALSFLASALTGAMGLGGGMLMLAVMAQLLPTAVLIPVHGVVQVGSNLGRAVIMRRHIARALVLPFLLGSVVGVALASQLVVALPKPVLELVLGLFILWSTWSAKLKPSRIAPRLFWLPGLVSSFATMFVGGTGPLVAAFLVPDPLTRHQVVATHAAFMTLQHGLKIGAFTALGFAFLPWLPLLVLMVALGFLGTMVGNRFLDRLPEKTFAVIFKGVLTLLALNIVLAGSLGLIG
ncbi:MAG: hypothetical protein OHK0024_35410 [Thalassobaculales bacterium]